MTRRLYYRAALRCMLGGAKLIQTNGKPTEFAVTPGGLVAAATAERILSHSLCEPADAGLPLPGDHPQSWKFKTEP
jgi:hypothetical protein